MASTVVTWADRLTDRFLGLFSRTRSDADRVVYGALQPADSGLWRFRFVVPVLFVVSIAINLARMPSDGWGVLWAEDGSIFMSGAISNHWALSMITPYNGYIHIVPRLIATVFGVVVPLPAMAVAFTVAAIVVMSALGCFVYVLSRSRFQSRYVSLLVWFAFVGMSMAGGEVLGSIANLHWFLDGTAVWILVMRHRSPSIRVISTVVFALAILSDGLTLIFIPLLLLRFLVIIEPARVRFLLVSVAAYVAQLVAIIAAPLLDLGTRHQAGRQKLGLAQLVHEYVDRVVLASSVGVKTVAHFGTEHQWTWYLGLAAVVVVVVLVAWRSHDRILAILLLAYSVAFFSASWIVAVGGGLPAVDLYDEGRYSVAPIVMFVAFVALALDGLLVSRHLTRVPATVITVALAAALVVVFVHDYQFWNPREGTPSLASSVSKAADSCRTQAPGTLKVVPVAPLYIFDIRLTCEQVLHGVH